MTREVRMVLPTLFPRSVQKLLYARRARSDSPRSPSMLSTLPCSTRCFANLAASSAVKNCLVPSSLGRWKGVTVALVQTPCRSGCPSGVRGGVQFCAATFATFNDASRIRPQALTGVALTSRSDMAFCSPSEFRYKLMPG